jgi:hypothetical protein
MKRSDECRVTSDEAFQPSQIHASRITHHASLLPKHQTPNTKCQSCFRHAFTLLEVMIASGIFFMATFAILALVAQTLRNARALERNEANAGMAAALIYDIVKTNRSDTGAGSGDFGNVFPEYSFEYEWHPSDLGPVTQTGSATMPAVAGQAPSLLEVDVVLNRRGSKLPADSLVFLVFNPVAQVRR